MKASAIYNVAFGALLGYLSVSAYGKAGDWVAVADIAVPMLLARWLGAQAEGGS
jgi:hypothetical protein